MSGSVLISLLSVVGLFIFSVLIFFEGDLCLVWFFLELAGLSLIPLFFSPGFSISMVGLFYYLVVSGVSSGLLLSGILFSDCIFFVLLGLLIKFGVFPFFGWIYSVLTKSNWAVIWGFSTLLKSPFILISFFLAICGFWVNIVVVLCCLSCLVASVLFWVFSVDWKVCWCHMVISSSSVLVCLSFSGTSLDSLLFVFVFYFVWSSSVIYFFYIESLYEMNSNNYFFFVFLFCFLVLTFPVSLSIFYKISVCLNIFSCGVPFLLCWVIYGISEQFYFLFSLIGVFGNKSSFGFSLLV